MPRQRYLCNFGLSQEDERTEAKALDLPGGRVLSIASAGDMPLSLLALEADSVIAVDNDPNQLHLCRLKAAAVQALERVEAIGFLGYMPAAPLFRRKWLQKVAEVLPVESRSFWLKHEKAISRGAVWSGRFERYIRRLQLLTRPLLGSRLKALFSCSTLEEQEYVFEKYFDRPFMHRIFDFAFNPSVFASRGMDRRSLQFRDQPVSLADQYFESFRRLCVGTLACENHLLQLTTIGRVLSADVVPAYLSVDGFHHLKSRLDNLTFVECDVLDYLRQLPEPTFDKVHLSNVPDWLPQEQFETLMCLVEQKTARPARLVWRHLHVDRPLPPSLQTFIRVDNELRRQLQQDDRFPFYSIVPTRIEDTGSVSTKTQYSLHKDDDV